MDADSYNVYSCRKFVGVPDGAYLVHTGLTDGIYPADTSWQHAAFLFRCIDESVNSAYGDSLDNESRFDGEIRGMSPSTRRILRPSSTTPCACAAAPTTRRCTPRWPRTMRWTARPVPMR